MTLKLSAFWAEFNDIIRSNAVDDDIAKKIRAVNAGNLYLSKRFFELNRAPSPLFVQPTNQANSDALNYIDLPAQFLRLEDIWVLSGTTYNILDKGQVIPYSELVRMLGNDFFDTTKTGDISYASIQSNKLYFNKFFNGAGTTNVKISYYKHPDEVQAYDRLAFTGLTGAFTVGETVTGGSSNGTATILTVSDTYIDVTTASRNSVVFINTETLTGATSGATATQSEDMVEKPQELEWPTAYKDLVIEASALMFYELDGSIETREKSDILDGLIKQLIPIIRTPIRRIRLGI